MFPRLHTHAFTLIELLVVRQRKRPAFTLIELLVVISIMSLLVALLLPALSRARQVSMDLSCLSTVRQLGTAELSYVVDSKQCFTPWVTAGNPTGASTNVYVGANYSMWLDTLWKDYLGKSNKPFECPAQESLRAANSYKRADGTFDNSVRFQPGYAINRFTTAGYWTGQYQPVKMDTVIGDPVQKVLFFDSGIGIVGGASPPNLDRSLGWAAVSENYSALNSQGGASGLAAATRHNPGYYYQQTIPGAIGRFTGGSNYMFMDGHAAYAEWYDMDVWLRPNADDTPSGYNNGSLILRTYWDTNNDGNYQTP